MKKYNLFEKMIKAFFPATGETKLGDFVECRSRIESEKGRFYALLWIISYLLKSFPSLIKSKIYWSMVMVRNYIKIALRTIRSNTVISLINIFGLSCGIAAVILIHHFISDELSYDSFHKKSNNIYRLYTSINNPDGSIDGNMDTVVIPHGPAMKDFFPEVVQSVRVYPTEFIVKHENIIESQMITYADKNFFTLFSFNLISGDPESILDQPNSLVLSSTFAEKYFGDNDPIGKTITIISGEYTNDFCITGIAEDCPANSTIQYNIIIPFYSMRLFGNAGMLERWQGWNGRIQTYIEVQDENSIAGIKVKYHDFSKQFYSATFERMGGSIFEGVESNVDPMSFGQQKLEDIHFDSMIQGFPDYTNIYILSGIAIGILIIACINFITQSLGLAAKRLIEVGLRKVVGANRIQLVRQFLIESVVIILFSGFSGILLTITAMPVFNELSEKSLELSSIFSMSSLNLIFSLMIILGICAGGYPAFAISKFRPVEILRGKFKISRKNTFSQILVIVQFACSVLLIISTLIIGNQIDYMINTDLGYEKDNVVIVRTLLNSNDANEKFYTNFTERIKQYPGIVNVTGASSALSLGNYTDIVIHNEKRFFPKVVRVKYDYFKTLGIKLFDGRVFSEELSSDISGVVVNETLIKEFEIENPIGMTLEGYHMPLNIIGVIKDIHPGTLRRQILPAMYIMNPRQEIRYILLKLEGNRISESLEYLQTVWQDLQPDKPFTYSFLDEDVEKQYISDKRWKSIIQYATFFAILIASLGIFGLISITINRRIKEVCIRKIHGAKVSRLIFLLSGESLILVTIANIIAWPAVWIAMSKWLENFAYTIEISPLIFILAAIITMSLVFVTILFQVLKAAKANPVNSLRYE